VDGIEWNCFGKVTDGKCVVFLFHVGAAAISIRLQKIGVVPFLVEISNPALGADLN
jgi:hypothetical protein